MANTGIQIGSVPGFVGGALCQLDGAPTEGYPYCWLSGGYWSYWHAAPGEGWTFSDFGAPNRMPPAGSVDGWRFAPLSSPDAVEPSVGPVFSGPDLTAPRLAFVGGPDGLVAPGTQATFAYTTDDPGAATTCRVDDEPWTPCDPPHAWEDRQRGHIVRDAETGSHVLTIRAVDDAGNEAKIDRAFTVGVEDRGGADDGEPGNGGEAPVLDPPPHGPSQPPSPDSPPTMPDHRPASPQPVPSQPAVPRFVARAVPAMALQGGRLRLQVTGAGPGERIRVRIGGRALATRIATKSGGWSGTLRLPRSVGQGRRTVTVAAGGRTARVTVQITRPRTFRVRPEHGVAGRGSRQVVRISGLLAREPYVVRVDGRRVSLAGATASSRGQATVRFEGGRSIGSHVVRVRGFDARRHGSVRYRVR